MPKKKPFKLVAPDPDEDQCQASIVSLFDRILPEDQVAWSHFPAGGYYLSPAARARLYRLGLKQGWPDLLICYEPCRSLWLEVKTRTGQLRPAQRSMHIRLRAMGHKVVVVRSIEDVIAALMEYGVPFRRARLAESYHGTAQSHTSATSGGTTQPAQGNGSMGGASPQTPQVGLPVVSL